MKHAQQMYLNLKGTSLGEIGLFVGSNMPSYIYNIREPVIEVELHGERLCTGNDDYVFDGSPSHHRSLLENGEKPLLWLRQGSIPH